MISIDCRCCDFFKFSSSGSFVKDQVEIYSGNIRRSIPKIFIKIMFQCGFSHYMFEATLPFLKDVAKQLGHWLGLDLFIKMCLLQF